MGEAAEKRAVLGDQRTRLHPVPGSKYGVWVTETVLECLSCYRLFWSWDVRRSRICPECKGDPNYQAITRLVEAGISSVYTGHLDVGPDEGGARKTTSKAQWDAVKTRGKAIKCPQCGEIVYRPGNASLHRCFTWSMADLDMKLNGVIEAQYGSRQLDHGRSSELRRNAEGRALNKAYKYLDEIDPTSEEEEVD